MAGVDSSRGERAATALRLRGLNGREFGVMSGVCDTSFLAIVLLCISLPATAAPPTAKIISVQKIWDKAPHCAFTDLIYWKDQFVCAFREGRAHVSTDGRIRVLTSPDGENWQSAAVLTLDGFDLRDAGLSVAPDDRLMLIGGAAPRKTDNDGAPTGSFVAFSDDAKTWTSRKSSSSRAAGCGESLGTMARPTAFPISVRGR